MATPAPNPRWTVEVKNPPLQICPLRPYTIDDYSKCQYFLVPSICVSLSGYLPYHQQEEKRENVSLFGRFPHSSPNLRIVWLDIEASQNLVLHIVVLPGYNGIALDKNKGIISIMSLASYLKPKTKHFTYAKK
jgi:hypothetical protein